MINKKLLITTSLLLIPVILICIFSVPKSDSIFTNADTTSKPTIILDAGHGGFDGGAVAEDGTVEKDINLKISLFLYDFLNTAGYNVIMTRQTDTSTEDTQNDKIPSRKKSDLENRLKLMKKYPQAVFVSIHLNKFTTSAASGSQVFYSGKTQDSKVLGEDIQKSIVSLLQPENNRVNKQATSSTYLLYNATIPAVLVECGFLSNHAELELLKSEEYQKKLSFCVFCGITEFFSKNKEI